MGRALLAVLVALSSCGAPQQAESTPRRGRHAQPRRERAEPQNAPPASSTGNGAGDVAQQAIAEHNRVRADVGVGPLRWSDSLAAQARDWAGQLCRRSRGGRVVLEHRPDNDHGENLYWQGGGGPPGVAEAVRSWENERRFYNPRNGQCRGGVCGHYTQVVWRGTSEVGCGTASCGESYFWVCNYDPPGNFVGQRAY